MILHVLIMFCNYLKNDCEICENRTCLKLRNKQSVHVNITQYILLLFVKDSQLTFYSS